MLIKTEWDSNLFQQVFHKIFVIFLARCIVSGRDPNWNKISQNNSHEKPPRYLWSLLLALVILFFIVTQFSATESKFQCTGQISNKGITTTKTVYIKLAEYRWWVGFWSNSDGSLNVEIPNTWFGYFEQVDQVGDQLLIYDVYLEKILKGNFSNLSKVIALETALGFFDGVCSIVD